MFEIILGEVGDEGLLRSRCIRATRAALLRDAMSLFLASKHEKRGKSRLFTPFLRYCDREARPWGRYGPFIRDILVTSLILITDRDEFNVDLLAVKKENNANLLIYLFSFLVWDIVVLN